MQQVNDLIPNGRNVPVTDEYDTSPSSSPRLLGWLILVPLHLSQKQDGLHPEDRQFPSIRLGQGPEQGFHRRLHLVRSFFTLSFFHPPAADDAPPPPSIIPQELLKIYDAGELELLISGLPTIDVDELKNSTQLHGWRNSDPLVPCLPRPSFLKLTRSMSVIQ